MKDIVYFIVGLAIVAGIFGGLGYGLGYNISKQIDLGSGGVNTSIVSPISKQASGTATTSYTFLTANATSTLTIDVSNADTLSLNACYKASGTPAVLQWETKITSDTATTTTTYFDLFTGSSTGAVASWEQGQVYNRWNPPTSASTTPACVHFPKVLTDITAKTVRIDYALTGANGSLYLEAITE